MLNVLWFFNKYIIELWLLHICLKLFCRPFHDIFVLLTKSQMFLTIFWYNMFFKIFEYQYNLQPNDPSLLSLVHWL